MAIVSQAGFPDSLDPVFKKIVKDGFGEKQDLVGVFFGKDTSDRHEEKYNSISSLDDLPEFGGSLTFLAPVEGYQVLVTHKEFAGGVNIQRKMWDDDQHGQIRKLFADLGRSGKRTRNKDAAQPFNNAFIVDSEFYAHDEAVSLCSSSHTTPDGDVSTSSGFDNLYTAALSGTAVAAARYNMRLLKDLKGEPQDEVPDMLCVPAELEDKALEIVRTRTGLDSAEGTRNIQEGRYRVFSTVRFTDTNNWFAINESNMKENLKWIDRVTFEEARMDAFDQIQFKGRGYQRYSYFHLFWQWVIGHQVS